MALGKYAEEIMEKIYENRERLAQKYAEDKSKTTSAYSSQSNKAYNYSNYSYRKV